MQNDQRTFFGAIWEEWRRPMAVPLRDRVKKAIEFIISMPFVYWAVSYEWSNKSMAWDYVVRGLISILSWA